MVSVFVTKSENGAIEAIFWVREAAEAYCRLPGCGGLIEEYELWELRMRHEGGWFLYSRPRMGCAVS
jgi:hypothetical protein